MSTLLYIAPLAGAASVLTPCVLPLLPAVFVVSNGADRTRAAGIITGIVASFAIAVLVLATLVHVLGLPANTLRWISGAMLVIFGLILVVPKFDEMFQRSIQGMVSRVPQGGRNKNGFVGGMLAGSTLGLVWAPCAGPILGSITVAAATQSVGWDTVYLTALYCVGLALPLTAIVLGGRRVADFMRARVGSGRGLQAAMGTILVITGVLIFSGTDTKVNSFLATHIGLSSTPFASLESKAVSKSHMPINKGATARSTGAASDAAIVSSTTAGDSSTAGDGAGPAQTFNADELKQNGYPESEGLVNYGKAKGFAGIKQWYNTPDGKAISLKSLKGKVVLVDFWTYSCINCLRSLPHIKQLYQDYAKQGLVVVGVHTPEFGFEADPKNVRKAVGDLGVEYPVALDADYKTWGNYNNHYWPAHYLLDKDGNIRSVHYGEGGYDTTENLVRKLLALAPAASAQTDDAIMGQTPEIYFGFQRAEHMAGGANGTEGLVSQNQLATYKSPITASAGLSADQWGFNGSWTVGGDQAVAGAGASLSIHYRAAKVFTVLGLAPGAKPATITIHDGSATRKVLVDGAKLYTLHDANQFGEGVLTFDVPAGVSAFTYTFG
ncbi:MAG: cytochrome c biogenesis protein DipZ [Thermoleophilia bacterium]|nr:cytochrome c biogenesis protein DipZ [Thermoleophilia bacterium]